MSRSTRSNRSHWLFLSQLTIAFLVFAVTTARAEDGYRLWLRYDPLPKEYLRVYNPHVTAMVAPGNSATLDAIRGELAQGLSGLLGRTIPLVNDVDRDGVILVGTPRNSPQIASLRWERPLALLGAEGFRIRSLRLGNHPVTVIASQSEVGALYGTFYFLRLIQTLQPIASLNVTERPRLQLRLLDHWDNLDGSIE